MVFATYLILWMLVIMATQIDGAKKKREALELAPGGPVVGPPVTKIPEGQPPKCSGHCGNGGWCKESCLRSEQKSAQVFVPIQQCRNGCHCCYDTTDPVITTTPREPICEGTRCGDGGKCRTDCSKYKEQQIPGQCPVRNCQCCRPRIITTESPTTPLPPGWCEFNGKVYKPRERIEGVCVDVTCENGQWVSQGYIDECCRRCNVEDDPHFISYDGLDFDFHGICNYSITQQYSSYYAGFGVYGDFYRCNGMRSCIDKTTFKDNYFTAIEMTRPGKENIKVNNVGFTVTPVIQPLMSHPVLTWKIGNCIRFLGSQRLVVDYCWSSNDHWRQLYLYAHPALVETLYGLCGYFNYYPQDDLTHRYGTITPYTTSVPNDFGDSWETNIQNSDCRKWTTAIESATKGGKKKRDTTGDDPCIGMALEPYMEICFDILSSVNYNGHFATPEQLQIHVWFCARDICAFAIDGNGIDRDEYFNAIQEFLQQTLMRDVMTTPGARPPKDEHCKPCNGTCGIDATCRYRCDSTEEEAPGNCIGEHCKCCKKKSTCDGKCRFGRKQKYQCKDACTQGKEKRIKKGKCSKGCICCGPK